MSVVGWIGLGNMGSRMTKHLIDAGHTVKGYDLNPDALKAAEAVGVQAVNSVAEAVDNADVVFTMLPKGEHVYSVFSGDDGVWAHAPKDALLIDSSTIDIETALKLHEESKEHGFQFVDAPVSGGISGAANATLAFMLGGEEDATAKAADYIKPMAGNVFIAGGASKGLAAKIANNMMLCINMLANAEGSQLAKNLGLDPKVFWEITSASSGRSWSQQTWYPVPGIIPTSASDNNFDATFSADLALKDVSLALLAGDSLELVMPAARLAQQQLEQLKDEGLAHKDCTLITKYVKPDAPLDGWDPSA